MANTTVQALADEVVFRTSPDSADTTYLPRIVSRLSWATQEIARILEPEEFEKIDTSITLATGVNSYTKPERVLGFQAIKIIPMLVDLRPLIMPQWAKVNEAIEGQPEKFFDYGGLLYIYPRPSADYNSQTLTAFYIQQPLALDLSGLSALPAKWDESLVLGAACKFLRDQGDFERAQAAYRDWISELKTHPTKRSIEFSKWGGRTLGIGRR